VINRPTPFTEPTPTVLPFLAATPIADGAVSTRLILNSILPRAETPSGTDEVQSIASLGRIITSSNLDTGLDIARIAWIVDGVTENERRALRSLREVFQKDSSWGEALAGLAWFRDGITEHERRALQHVEQVHQRRSSVGVPLVDLGIILSDLPWFQDGVTEHERWALRSINDVHKEDSTLAAALIDMPWFTDGITEFERWALSNIGTFVRSDAALAKATANLPWFQDDITKHERFALRHLKDIREADPELANALAVMPFFTGSIQEHDAESLDYMLNLQDNHPDILAELLGQDWYQDGLDDQEATLVMIVGTPASSILGPEDLRGFITKNHAESRMISLPLAGPTELVFFETAPQDTNQEIVDQVEDAIRLFEEFLGVPFPLDQAALLLAAPDELGRDFNVIGINRGTHMIIDPTLARQGDNNRVINHETAHFYWGYDNSPLWFAEGGADFLSSYVRDQLYGDTFDDRLRYFPGHPGAVLLQRRHGHPAGVDRRSGHHRPHRAPAASLRGLRLPSGRKSLSKYLLGHRFRCRKRRLEYYLPIGPSGGPARYRGRDIPGVPREHRRRGYPRVPPSLCRSARGIFSRLVPISFH
jgi:hypothetical protein